jgi:hypothetical protein
MVKRWIPRLLDGMKEVDPFYERFEPQYILASDYDSRDLITRDQFDALAMEYADNQTKEMGITTAKTLLSDARIGYDKLPPHLKKELHMRVGFEPVQMFRRIGSPASGAADK